MVTEKLTATLLPRLTLEKRKPSNFGAKLKGLREARGVSLRQVADATRISLSVLEALERNDISRLPGGIYGRGFVRSYAIEVGLNPEGTVREFLVQFPAFEMQGVGSLQTSEQRSTSGAARQKRLFLVGVALLAIGVIVLFVLTLLQ